MSSPNLRNNENIGMEIDSLEVQLSNNPNNLRNLCRIADLLIKDRRVAHSKQYVDRAANQFKNTQLSLTQAKDVISCMLSYWKADRYAAKTRRLNIGAEREGFLWEIEEVTHIARGLKDGKASHWMSLKLAFIKESEGLMEDALAILSDLIAEQATGDGIDLSFIIFKAAVLLQHLGQVKQSIEYLEFITDDPPAGYQRLHVVAFLAHVYEQGGSKYQVFLPKTYKLLEECCNSINFEESAALTSSPDSSLKAANSNNQEEIANQKLLFSRLQAAAAEASASSTAAGAKGRNTGAFFSRGSELWELLGLQALERCEYVLALEFLSEAAAKAPTKGKLLHLVAEIHTLLKKNEAAAAYAEKAYVFLPQSAQLRNLLLVVAPDVWTEKLRSVAPIARQATNAAEHDDDNDIAGMGGGNDNDDDNDADFEDFGAEYGFGGGSGYGGSLSSGASASFRGDGGTPKGGAGGGGGFEGTGGAPLNQSKSFRDKAMADQKNWVKNIRTKAGEALKAVNSGASISDAIAVAKSAGNTRIPASSSVDAGPSLAPKVAKAGDSSSNNNNSSSTSGKQKNGKGSTAGSSSSSSSSSNAKGGRKSPSPTREGSKNEANKLGKVNTSKIKRVKPTNKSGTTATATTRNATSRSKSPPKQKAGNVDTADKINNSGSVDEVSLAAASAESTVANDSLAAASAESAVNGSLAASIEADNDGGGLAVETTPSDSKQQQQQEQQLTRSASSRGTPSSSLTRSLSGSAKLEKQSPAVEPMVPSSRPVKPEITEDSKKMLKLVLEGNTNIPIYDPNLKILMEMRSSTKQQ